MAVLQSTNVQGSLCVNGVAIGGGKDFKYCCFTASDTWTPTQDLVDGDGVVDATLVGGGGGGGGAVLQLCGCNRSQNLTVTAGGGGGGQLLTDLVDITATDACTVTIGAGGSGQKLIIPSFQVAATISSSGVDGGDTEFGGTSAYGGGSGNGCSLACCVGFAIQYASVVCSDSPYSGRAGQTNANISDATLSLSSPSFEELTGSVTRPTAFTDCCNPHFRDNGEMWGGGGSNNLGGNEVTGSMSPYNTPNDFATKVCICRSNTVNCIGPTDEEYQFPSPPTNQYGGGGYPGKISGCVTTGGSLKVCQEREGGTGQSGIVVLKWFE